VLAVVLRRGDVNAVDEPHPGKACERGVPDRHLPVEPRAVRDHEEQQIGADGIAVEEDVRGVGVVQHELRCRRGVGGARQEREDRRDLGLPADALARTVGP
jgi:hypothetical protein